MHDTSELSFKIYTCKGFTDVGHDFFTFFMTIYTVNKKERDIWAGIMTCMRRDLLILRWNSYNFCQGFWAKLESCQA